jgi:hypothetical protein
MQTTTQGELALTLAVVLGTMIGGCGGQPALEPVPPVPAAAPPRVLLDIVSDTEARAVAVIHVLDLTAQLVPRPANSWVVNRDGVIKSGLRTIVSTSLDGRALRSRVLRAPNGCATRKNNYGRGFSDETTGVNAPGIQSGPGRGGWTRRFVGARLRNQVPIYAVRLTLTVTLDLPQDAAAETPHERVERLRSLWALDEVREGPVTRARAAHLLGSSDSCFALLARSHTRGSFFVC